MAAENVSATRAPTPGVVMRRRTRLSARAMVNNRFSTARNSRPRAARALRRASAMSDNALGAVAGLADKSLLLRAESTVPTRPLYQMLETVRAYAALELTAAVEREDALEGLARYCAAEASLAADGLVGVAQVEWLDRVRQDLESYRAALTWLIDRDRPAEEAEIAWSLFFFWAIRGHTAEGIRWYEQILSRRSLPPAVEARALLGTGAMRIRSGPACAVQRSYRPTVIGSDSTPASISCTVTNRKIIVSPRSTVRSTGASIGTHFLGGNSTGTALNDHFELLLLYQSADTIRCERDSLLSRSGFRRYADSH